MLHSTPLETTYPATMQMPRKIRALLLDDSNFDRARIRRLSTQTDLPIQMDEVDSISQLDAAVAQNHYDLIMIDYRLPVGDGMVALNHVLNNAMNKDAGKIMITGNSAVDTAVQAMRGGCHDFLSKDEMDSDLLRGAILNAMTVAQQNQHLALRADQQRNLIREGLVAALQDEEVTGSVISLVRQHFGTGLGIASVRDTSGVEIMIADMGDEDEFIFH